MSDYDAFLASKARSVAPSGFDVPAAELSPRLFPFQRDIVRWALLRGRAALFEECGLGKSIQQLEWARCVAAHTGGRVLILAPLAVAKQTVHEAEKFGIAGASYCRSQADVATPITLTNYDMAEHFDFSAFVGIVCDESSILKNFMGKTKRFLIDACSAIPYKLCCTATPAPNDHMEIGNHAEFLGIMPANEMLTRWFINDTTHFGNYHLKGHAVRPFWDWVASWAVSARRPSDLGYPDHGYPGGDYDLPPLEMEQITVSANITEDAGALLFRIPSISATTMHAEMRRTAANRAEAAAALVNSSAEPWAVWCNTNYEADEIKRRIPDAIEVRGSDALVDKERRLLDFADGRARVLLTKPGIAGHGLNFQRCANTAFVGLSYSFEDLYQALRRFYRFGQTRPVRAYIITAETEGAILHTVQEKMRAHQEMFDSMALSSSKLALQTDLALSAYEPRLPMIVPSWIRSVVL